MIRLIISFLAYSVVLFLFLFLAVNDRLLIVLKSIKLCNCMSLSAFTLTDFVVCYVFRVMIALLMCDLTC